MVVKGIVPEDEIEKFFSRDANDYDMKVFVCTTDDSEMELTEDEIATSISFPNFL